MVRLKRLGAKGGKSTRFFFMQLGWPSSQRNYLLSSVTAMPSTAVVRHCSPSWNTAKRDNTRISNYFPLANKDQGLFSTCS